MNRFFGMMPKEEVKLQKTFKDTFGYRITIQAGETGYSILYSDCSSEYEDITDTAENNFKRAYEIIKDSLYCKAVK